MRKMRHENEQLKLAKRSMENDISKLGDRRGEIDNLHSVLIGIINHSTAKKIDVEELRVKLAESMRRGRHESTLGGVGAEMSLKKRQKSGPRAKSPLGHNGLTYSSDGLAAFEGGMDTAITLKPEETPAWYKALKKK